MELSFVCLNVKFYTSSYGTETTSATVLKKITSSNLKPPPKTTFICILDDW
ncbi:hypothetical protein Lgra_0449 [Legionella gratiana]|uniref:Uncharacterized protein n=1 Tax=Legionella gratiana TaxID=45066 RepID=A0A378J8Z2_9GAMM|nr:hypothetical protein Lgra_0449 [Legionella gratiana]STX44273.1 Uncharacterised protein [Legionella gratiana]